MSSFSLYNKDHRKLSKEEHAAFLSLLNNDAVIIQKADKGNTVVNVDEVICIERMEELLSDTSKFHHITFNSEHLLDTESTIKACLDHLRDHNYLSTEDHKFMNPPGSRPGVMYEICKVHKEVDSGDGIHLFQPNFRRPPPARTIVEVHRTHLKVVGSTVKKKVKNRKKLNSFSFLKYYSTVFSGHSVKIW